MTDMFSGLGKKNAGRPEKLPYFEGLGSYICEILKFRSFQSEQSGANCVVLELKVVEVVDHRDEDAAQELHPEQKPSHDVGFSGTFFRNLTADPYDYNIRDVRGMIDAIAPHAAGRVDTARLQEVEAAGGDVYAELARQATAPPHTQFAGVRIGVLVTPSTKKDGTVTKYTKPFFMTEEDIRRRMA